MKSLKVISLALVASTISISSWGVVLYKQNFEGGNLDGISIGTNVKLVPEGFDGNNYSIETTYDSRGHAAFVSTIHIPTGHPTVYVRFYQKVSPASVYEQYRPKRLKLRAWSPDRQCYWNITLHRDAFNYGGTDGCENDAQHVVKQYETSPSLATGLSVTFNKVPPTSYHYPENQWVCFEYQIVANDSNHAGSVNEWVNGNLFWSIGGLHLRPTGNTWTFSQIDFGGWTAGLPAPTLAHSWIDDIEVSTDRIGCLSNPPSAPQVQVQ